MAQKPIDALLDKVEWTPTENGEPREEWKPGDLPYATHSGMLDLGGIMLRVYQLNTGDRVIDGEDVEKFLGGMQ
jgi:hypothetical protein